jgi:hypothetical protein
LFVNDINSSPAFVEQYVTEEFCRLRYLVVVWYVVTKVSEKIAASSTHTPEVAGISETLVTRPQGVKSQKTVLICTTV